VGAEFYQGRPIKIEDVNVVDPNGWGPGGELVLTDGKKTLPVKLGRGNGIYRGSYNLTEPFDVIGILDQESTNLRSGYRLYVVNCPVPRKTWYDPRTRRGVVVWMRLRTGRQIGSLEGSR
jgi:hypothetical protein